MTEGDIQGFVMAVISFVCAFILGTTNIAFTTISIIIAITTTITMIVGIKVDDGRRIQMHGGGNIVSVDGGILGSYQGRHRERMVDCVFML